MKAIPVEQSVGMVLAHDMTEIIPGKSKGAAFKKGHIIKEEDIPRLLNMGKEHIYIIEYKEGDVYENEAAERMAKAAAGQGISFSEPSEGKVNLITKYSGLLKVNYKALLEINRIEGIVMATLHTDRIINAGTVAAGTRIIPLITEDAKICAIEEICKANYPIVQVLPFKKLKAGIVTTGNEVFHKRIPDKFGPVVKKKFEELGCEVTRQIFSKDDPGMIAQCIELLIAEGAEIVTVTGGMSVDPDDATPGGIKALGADIVAYGAPTLPGSMFMIAYKNNIPVLGLPGCVMYSKTTIFDLILTRLVAGEKITREDVIKLGHGGICLGCKECVYPDCGFGKGGLF